MKFLLVLLLIASCVDASAMSQAAYDAECAYMTATKHSMDPHIKAARNTRINGVNWRLLNRFFGPCAGA